MITSIFHSSVEAESRTMPLTIALIVSPMLRRERVPRGGKGGSPANVSIYLQRKRICTCFTLSGSAGEREGLTPLAQRGHMLGKHCQAALLMRFFPDLQRLLLFQPQTCPFFLQLCQCTHLLTYYIPFHSSPRPASLHSTSMHLLCPHQLHLLPCQPGAPPPSLPTHLKSLLQLPC